MSIMSENDMVIGLPKLSQHKSVCGGCLMSKQSRKSFPSKSCFTTKEYIQLIHADICGPITLSTSDGNHYFLILVDDFTHVLWVRAPAQKQKRALDAFI